MKQHTPDTVGQRIRYLREHHDMTRTELFTKEKATCQKKPSAIA